MLFRNVAGSALWRQGQNKGDDLLSRHFARAQQSSAVAGLVEVQADIVRTTKLMRHKLMGLVFCHGLTRDDIAPIMGAASECAQGQCEKGAGERVGRGHGFPILGSVPALMRATLALWRQ